MSQPTPGQWQILGNNLMHRLRDREVQPVTYNVPTTTGTMRRIEGTVTRQDGELFLVDGSRKRTRWEKAIDGDNVRVHNLQSQHEGVASDIMHALAQVAAAVGQREGQVHSREEAVLRAQADLQQQHAAAYHMTQSSSELLQQTRASAESTQAREAALAQSIAAYQEELASLRARASHVDATEESVRPLQYQQEQAAAQVSAMQHQMGIELEQRQQALNRQQEELDRVRSAQSAYAMNTEGFVCAQREVVGGVSTMQGQLAELNGRNNRMEEAMRAMTAEIQHMRATAQLPPDNTPIEEAVRSLAQQMHEMRASTTEAARAANEATREVRQQRATAPPPPPPPPPPPTQPSPPPLPSDEDSPNHPVGGVRGILHARRALSEAEEEAVAGATPKFEGYRSETWLPFLDADGFGVMARLRELYGPSGWKGTLTTMAAEHVRNICVMFYNQGGVGEGGFAVADSAVQTLRVAQLMALNPSIPESILREKVLGHLNAADDFGATIAKAAIASRAASKATPHVASVTCHNCGKKGHVAANCFAKKRKNGEGAVRRQ